MQCQLMKSTIKFAIVTLFTLQLIVATTLVSSIFVTASASKGKSGQKPTDPTKSNPSTTKCNNIKVQVKVSNIPVGSSSVIGKVTLDGKTLNKTAVVGKNGSKATLPLSFKKLNPCPSIGDSFSGDVNGTSFSGKLASLKAPNKVNVSLA